MPELNERDETFKRSFDNSKVMISDNFRLVCTDDHSSENWWQSNNDFRLKIHAAFD